MKKIIFILVVALAPAFAFADTPTDQKIPESKKTLDAPEKIMGGYSSPFEDELNTLYYTRNFGGNVMWVGSILTLSGFVLTSTAVTAQGLGKLDSSAAVPCIITGYIFTIVSAAITGWGFSTWYQSSNDYQDTLRLQSQYYNILDK